MWAFLRDQSLVLYFTILGFSLEISFISRLHLLLLCTWFSRSSPTKTSLLSSSFKFPVTYQTFPLRYPAGSVWTEFASAEKQLPLLTSLFLLSVSAVAYAQNSGVIFDSLSSLGPQSNQAANLIHSFLTMSLAAVPFHFCCCYAHLHPYQLT